MTFGKKIPPGNNVHRKATFFSGKSPFSTEVGYWGGYGVKIFVMAKVCLFVAKISLNAIYTILILILLNEERHKDDFWQIKPPK